MVTNRFFSAVVRIQRDRSQVVVTHGPYRFVRHPGYAGALLVTIAGPLMLDACWTGVPTAVVDCYFCSARAFRASSLGFLASMDNPSFT